MMTFGHGLRAAKGKGGAVCLGNEVGRGGMEGFRVLNSKFRVNYCGPMSCDYSMEGAERVLIGGDCGGLTRKHKKSQVKGRAGQELTIIYKINLGRGEKDNPPSFGELCRIGAREE
jgi:hypothetical protein